MILETELPAFHEWIAWAPLLWLAVVGGVAVLGLLFGSLVAVVRHGPVAGLEITGKVLLSSVWDLFNMLPRSLRWLNWLVNKGALPYRVLAVVMLFIVFLGLAFVILDRETPLSLPLIVICSVAVAVVFLVIFFMFVCLVCEFLCMSPRRLGALAWLAVKDSLRRRVLIVFILFLLLLLFAGWFLDPGNEHPLRLYIGFVLTATSYLVLLLMLFLSALSLPTDLKNKTLHTVVTKPVRPSEIVLGRMLGFIALGTLLLVVMGAISYIFVVRGLNHTHDVLPGSLKAVAPGDDPAKGDVPLKGTSSMANGHRHNVLLGPTGNGRLEMAQDHFHRVVAKQEGDKTRYEVGPPEGLRIARVPVYGKLRFIDSQRHEADKGTNVGDEWTYRSYIEGGSLAAGVWSFEGVTPQAFSDQLQLEMTLGVFRTYKGDINKGIPGVLLLRNPKSGLTVETKIFESREFSTDVHRFPRKLTPMTAYVLRREEDAEGKVKYVRDELPGAMKSRYDLFDDLTDDGRVEVWLQCLDAMQFFGTAQPDLYLRAQDASFALNFAKGYFGIWMQMVLVVSFGVMFSTFLTGPIAMIATVGTLVLGFFRDYMVELALGKTYGGGPVESFIRLLTQDNVVSDLPAGIRTTVAHSVDAVLEKAIGAMAQVLPPFGRFECPDYVAHGFNVPADWIAERGLTALGFAVALFVVGYFFMKTREVAR